MGAVVVVLLWAQAVAEAAQVFAAGLASAAAAALAVEAG